MLAPQLNSHTVCGKFVETRRQEIRVLQDIATAVASHDPGATVVLLGDFNVVPSDECWRWEVGRASGWRYVKYSPRKLCTSPDSACFKCCERALWCLQKALR